MSFSQYIRRTALLVVGAFAVLALVLGIGVAVSMAAAHRSETVPAELIEPESAPSVVPTPRASTAPEPDRPRVRVQERHENRPEAARPPVQDRLATPARPRTIRLSPVTALGSQSTVDTGALVAWMTSPVCLLAGHNTMGWAWMDDLSNGTRVRVTSGPCVGLYEVYDRRSQARKGGPVPGWMSAGGLDLVLQTCKTRGMGFALLRRV